jgi:RimJ/RimL family protein N-acetyltransferase
VEIQLAGFLIREWRRGDEESLVRHANNPLIARNLRDIFPSPYTLSDAYRWVAYASAQKPITNFAIVVNGDASGGIGFVPQGDVARRSVEIGYWLGEAYWGRGIITAALRTMSNHIFQNFDVCRIFCTVFETNPASIRALEKAGYEFEGRLRKAVTKNGETLDALMFALVSQHGTRTPNPEPRTEHEHELRNENAEG